MNTEAPHTLRRWTTHQLYRDVSIIALLVVSVSAHCSGFSSKATLLPASARKLILEKHLSHLKPYEHCIVAAASKTRIPEMLLLSILYQEGGRSGEYSKNKNNTKDYGVSQINDVREDEISEIGLSLSDVKNNGCKSIIAMTYLLRNEYVEAEGDMWEAVGNYHYSRYGPNPKHHYKYILGVHKKWQTMHLTIKQAVLSGQISFKKN